jgi:hypothetical protein
LKNSRVVLVVIDPAAGYKKGHVMTVAIPAAPRQITTDIRYVVKGERSIYCPGEREKTYWPRDDRPMTLTDMRPLQGQITIARNGFTLVNHVTAAKNLFDPEELQRVLVPEIIAEAKRLNGAAYVVVFDAMIRSDGPDSTFLPIFGVHVDYSRPTIEGLVRPMLGGDADYWFSKRVVMMNFWRPITTVYRTPLALCDASTVVADDMNTSEVRAGPNNPNRSPLYGFNLSYNPAHRWYFVHQMRPDEMFAFKLYDSDASQPQWTGHCAFTDPETPPDAPPRQSIELRTLSFIETY